MTYAEHGPLAGTIALTGASRVAGKGIALVLAERGATVYVEKRAREVPVPPLDLPERKAGVRPDLVAAPRVVDEEIEFPLIFGDAPEHAPHSVVLRVVAPGGDGGTAAGADLVCGVVDGPGTVQRRRLIAALAADPDVFSKSGRVLTTPALAKEYGFTDIDGKPQSTFWARHWAGAWGSAPSTAVRPILRPVSRAATVRAPRSATPRTTQTSGLAGTRAADDAPPGSWSRAWPFLCAFALYLAISLATWWHLLAHGFGAAIPAGSADPAQEVWFLAWLPHALAAGLNPFFSHAVFAPSGVNLLDNTSMDFLGLLLAPVTVTAGPVASLDVAVLLAPALSALGAFALCRRHVTWLPAAFAGGLCYGFGPFLTGDLRYGHLDLTWLVLPPLILCCLDALLVRGTRRPLLVGAVLGILVVAQFFVSTELLAITALMAAVLAIVMSLGWPRAVLPSLAAARRGLALAAVIVVAALAYPFWVVVAGPRHVVGPIWRHVGAIATSLAATVEPHAELAGVAFISGSNGSYLGVALLVVLVVGAVVLWRSPILRVLLLTALAAYVVSLGYELHIGRQALDVALPAALLAHVPLLDSIVPERFAAMVDLLCGVALAVIIDHVRRWERPRPRRATPFDDEVSDRGAAAEVTPVRPAMSLLVALSVAVGVFALVPFVAPPHWPYSVIPISRPAVFSRSTLDSGDARGGAVAVVAIYPDASRWVADEMVWQAEDGFSFSLPDGYAIVPGPGLRAVESPPIDALWLVFAAGSVHRLHLPLAQTTRVAVRGDVDVLGIDDVVVLPGEEGSTPVRRALTEVLGPPEMEQGGAARWRVRASDG